MDAFRRLLSRYRNFVFIGEAGSGKTEIAINLAMTMAADGDAIHFFDMDQTKPLFRSRDSARQMQLGGISVHAQEQFQDIPTMVPGVIESLLDTGRRTLLDIGGNTHGARMVGQLAHCLNRDDTYVAFAINVYRPWSQNARNILETMSYVMQACRVKDVRIISNPNLGPTTTVEEIVAGHSRLVDMLGGKYPVDCICIREELRDAVPDTGIPVLPIKRYISYPDE